MKISVDDFKHFKKTINIIDCAVGTIDMEVMVDTGNVRYVVHTDKVFSFTYSFETAIGLFNGDL